MWRRCAQTFKSKKFDLVWLEERCNCLNWEKEWFVCYGAIQLRLKLCATFQGSVDGYVYDSIILLKLVTLPVCLMYLMFCLIFLYKPWFAPGQKNPTRLDVNMATSCKTIGKSMVWSWRASRGSFIIWCLFFPWRQWNSITWFPGIELFLV